MRTKRLAIAMNRLGAASNSGEGGEDEERYVPLANGDSLKSSIKASCLGAVRRHEQLPGELARAAD